MDRMILILFIRDLFLKIKDEEITIKPPPLL